MLGHEISETAYSYAIGAHTAGMRFALAAEQFRQSVLQITEGDDRS
jgi:hypothetical protein